MGASRWAFVLPLLLPSAAVAQAGGDAALTGWAQFYLQLAEGEDPLPVGMAAVDHRSWHFEARYNYEATETASLWVGWNLSTGSAVRLDFTPMAAVVAGAVDGVAPGFEVTVSWEGLTFYDEAEVVIPFDPEPAFLITWSTLTWRFSDLLQPGLTAQRFRVYSGEREVDWGLALNSEFGRISTGVYAYAPFGSSAFWQLSAAWNF